MAFYADVLQDLGKLSKKLDLMDEYKMILEISEELNLSLLLEGESAKADSTTQAEETCATPHLGTIQPQTTSLFLPGLEIG